MKIFLNSFYNKGFLHEVDIETFEDKLIFKTDVKSSFIDNETNIYKNDKVSIYDTYMTMAYVNNIYNIYGLLRDIGGNIVVIWISKDVFNRASDNEKDLISNVGNAIDISHIGKKVFSINNEFKFASRFVSELHSKSIRQVKFEEFIKLDGINIIDSGNINEQSINENKSDNKVIRGNDEVSADAYEKILSSIDSKLEDIKNISESLGKREKDIEEKEAYIKEMLSVANDKKLNDMDVTLIGVTDLIPVSDAISVESIEQPDYMYEALLKTLQPNDSVSIPIKYYNKLKVELDKTLESYSNNTKYRIMATIRFEEASINSIFAIIDYNSNDDIARVYVLKPYNSKRITDNDKAYYILSYNEWHTKYSYMKR